MQKHHLRNKHKGNTINYKKELWNMDKLYCCYSPKLKEYLNNNDIRYELCCKNINTDKTCWIYIKDDKLISLLKEWSNNR